MKRSLAGLLLIALFASLTAVWFGSLDYRRLVRPDEGRYAEIPREMVASGDWVTPRLNGIKYFEKPALQYWTTAAAYEVFGEHHWTARSWPALTGFLGVLLAFYTARRLWGPTAGWLAAGMLGSSLFYNVIGHIITLDMTLTFFLQLALTGFIFAQQDDAYGKPGASRRWMLLAWAGIALAVLSKGLVALVLTGGVMVVYTLLNRDAGPWKRFHPVAGIALFLAIAAPWFIAVSLANPEFPHFFFIHEHFERFLTKEHHRYQPNWYFLPMFLLGALPWCFIWLQGLLKSWTPRRAGEFNVERFLLIWVVLTFAFFSFSSSKLPSYILPIFPALALLSARVLSKISRRALAIHLSLILLVAIPAVVFAPKLAGHVDADYSAEMMSGLAHWVTAAAGLWLATIVTALVLTWKQLRMPALTVLASGSFLATTVVLLGHDQLAPFNSAYAIAQQVKPLLTPGVPFYSVRNYEQTLPFYIKRPITLVDYTDEMEFGLKQQPELWVPTVDEFRQRWAKDRDAFALLSQSTYAAYKAEGFPMIEIAQDQRNVIIRKPQPAAANPTATQP